MAMAWCEWCMVDSGRVGKGRPCCEARELANMPMDQRQDVLRSILSGDGRDARDATLRTILEYRAIQLAKVPKEGRQRAYRRQQIETGAADAELLKELVVAQYERNKVK